MILILEFIRSVGIVLCVVQIAMLVRLWLVLRANEKEMQEKRMAGEDRRKQVPVLPSWGVWSWILSTAFMGFTIMERFRIEKFAWQTPFATFTVVLGLMAVRRKIRSEFVPYEK